MLPTAVSNRYSLFFAANEDIFELLDSFHFFFKGNYLCYYYYPAPQLPVRLHFFIALKQKAIWSSSHPALGTGEWQRGPSLRRVLIPPKVIFFLFSKSSSPLFSSVCPLSLSNF